jgi:hypothetical protein
MVSTLYLSVMTNLGRAPLSPAPLRGNARGPDFLHRHGRACPGQSALSLQGATDLGFTRDRQLTMRKSGKPDFRGDEAISVTWHTPPEIASLRSQ